MSRLETLRAEADAIKFFLRDLMRPESHNASGGPSKRGIVNAIQNYLRSLQACNGRLPAEMIQLMQKLKNGRYEPGDMIARAIEKEQLLLWTIECGVEIKQQLEMEERLHKL
jgi:hypothetical protein